MNPLRDVQIKRYDGFVLLVKVVYVAAAQVLDAQERFFSVSLLPTFKKRPMGTRYSMSQHAMVWKRIRQDIGRFLIEFHGFNAKAKTA